MLYQILLFAILVLSPIAPIALAQEVQLGTYHELARIITNVQSSNTTASITLQSSNINEITIPKVLVDELIQDSDLNTVAVTSRTQCVPGVEFESCVIINFDRRDSWVGINAIHEGARESADALIDDVNSLFKTDAVFHSIYIHSSSDAISGIAESETISVIYTMPEISSEQMYDKVTVVLSEQIRDSDGFYASASKISKYDNSTSSFVITMINGAVLMQLVTEHAHLADSTETIFPLKLLGVKELKRSEYFDGGFYPLNSLVQTIVFNAPSDVKSSEPPLLQVVERNGVPIPTSVDTAGWVIEEGNDIVDAKYLFGTDKVAHADDTWFSFVSHAPLVVNTDEGFNITESLWILGIIPIIIAVAYIAKKRR